jgi:hypothetical protein
MSMNLYGRADDAVRNLIKPVVFSHFSALSASRR